MTRTRTASRFGIKSNLKSSLGLAISAAVLMIAAPASADEYNVELNKTELLRLPIAAAAVVIGNPDIADVSVHSQNTLFVVGRSYGTTNLIILDNQGNTVLDADVNVIGGRSGQDVRVLRGSERESWNCAPECSPAPVLGDNRDFVRDFTGQASPINNNVASQFQAVGANARMSGGPAPASSGPSAIAPSGGGQSLSAGPMGGFPDGNVPGQ